MTSNREQEQNRLKSCARNPNIKELIPSIEKRINLRNTVDTIYFPGNWMHDIGLYSC